MYDERILYYYILKKFRVLRMNNNRYKYILSMALAAVLMAIMPKTANAADREHTLKVYNWADYIDESLLDEFEVWYRSRLARRWRLSTSSLTSTR